MRAGVRARSWEVESPRCAAGMLANKAHRQDLQRIRTLSSRRRTACCWVRARAHILFPAERLGMLLVLCPPASQPQRPTCNIKRPASSDVQLGCQGQARRISSHNREILETWSSGAGLGGMGWSWALGQRGFCRRALALRAPLPPTTTPPPTLPLPCPALARLPSSCARCWAARGTP